MNRTNDLADWTDDNLFEKVELIALNTLENLGCTAPPVVCDYFPKTGVAPALGLSPKGLKFAKPDFVYQSAHQIAQEIVKGLGLSGPELKRKVGELLVFELLAPKSWIEAIWRLSHGLGALANQFPCLKGEKLAIRLSDCWKSSSRTGVSWIQGGRIVWRMRGGVKVFSAEMTELERLAVDNCRNYSRGVRLEGKHQEVHAWPSHEDFPRGEVLVCFPLEFECEPD